MRPRFVLTSLASMVLMTFGGHAQADDRRWYTLTIDGERIGYAWQEVTRERETVVYSEHVRIDVTQFRKSSSIERNLRIERNEEGRPLRVAVDAQAGVDEGGWKGTFDSKVATMTVAASETRRATTVALPRGMHLPDDVSSALQPLWSGATAEINAPMLDLSRAAANDLRAKVVVDEAAASRNLTRIRTTLGPAAVSDRDDLWFDRKGVMVRREELFFGAPLIWELCEADCGKQIDAPFDPMARLVVRSPFRIPGNAMSGPIRYVIRRTDGAPPPLVATSEQAVVRDGEHAIVTICADCGKPEGVATSAELEHYLAPNPWVQSSNQRVRDLARHAGSSKIAVRWRMERLIEAVQEHMTGPVNYLGYATSVEALKSRSGDCTEFAVLLAAVARSKQIPARVVIGLVYADRFSGKKDVFSPHAWVQVWDKDRWVSYDAALDGFDATHIALAVGDGDPRQFADAFGQLAQLQIEKAGVIRASN